MLHDLALIAPMLMVLLAALFTLVLDTFISGSGERDTSRAPNHFWGPFGAAASFSAMAVAGLLWWTGPHEMQTVAFGMHLSATPFSLFFVMLTAACAGLTLLSSPRYLEEQGISYGEYFALVHFATFGMMTMVAAESMLTLFVGLETMSMSIYVLAAFKRKSLGSVEAGMKYFLMGAAASALLLYGMAFLVGIAGGTSYAEISRALATELGADKLYLSLAVTLSGAAFLFKVAAVPFHMWTPDAYEGAPTPITGFMSSGVKAAAFGAFLKFMFVGLAGVGIAGLPVSVPEVLAFVAVLTMTVGNVMALPQLNVKRVLAYSAIAHAGYLLLGCVAMSADPTLGDPYTLPGANVPFYLIGYALASLAAFAALSTVGAKGQELTRESELAGLGWRYPFAGVVLAMAMFSLAGVPPLLGFFGKFSLLKEVLSVDDGKYLPHVVIMVLNSVVSAYYYLRVTVYIYMKPADDQQVEPIRDRSLSWAMALAALALIGFGLMPGKAMELSAKAASSVRTADVIAQVQHELLTHGDKGAAAARPGKKADVAQAE